MAKFRLFSIHVRFTSEDVVRVLRAGAADAIRKGYPESKPEAKKLALSRLDHAQKFYRSQEAGTVQGLDLNVNVTLFRESALG